MTKLLKDARRLAALTKRSFAALTRREVAELQKDPKSCAALTRFMGLSSQVADRAIALYDTEEAWEGMEVMEAADQIAEAVGVVAVRCGYTMDEVMRPLWGPPSSFAPQTAHLGHT